MTDMTQRAEWVAIDIYAAEQHGRMGTARIGLAGDIESLHHIVGDRRVRDALTPRGKMGNWAMDDATAWDTAMAMIVADDTPCYDIERLMITVESIATNGCTLVDASEEACWAADMYTGWSRFFIVVSSDGHIHSSMECSTCYMTTRYGWLPELSGLSEADAVAAHGAILCTVCYPTAPVEWTNGERIVDDGRCTGAITRMFREGHWGRGYRGDRWEPGYGLCECGKEVSVSRDGKPRKHAAWTDADRARAAKRLEREAREAAREAEWQAALEARRAGR